MLYDLTFERAASGTPHVGAPMPGLTANDANIRLTLSCYLRIVMVESGGGKLPLAKGLGNVPPGNKPRAGG